MEPLGSFTSEFKDSIIKFHNINSSRGYVSQRQSLQDTFLSIPLNNSLSFAFRFCAAHRNSRTTPYKMKTDFQLLKSQMVALMEEATNNRNNSSRMSR